MNLDRLFFFTLMRSIANTPARARNVIESGPQAALFVLLRPSAEPVYRDPRTRTGERMRSLTLIERKQFRLTRAVVRSAVGSDRIDDFCDVKVSRMARTSRDRRNEVTRIPIARSFRALVFLAVRLVSPLFFLSFLARPLRGLYRGISRARDNLESRRRAVKYPGFREISNDLELD